MNLYRLIYASDKALDMDWSDIKEILAKSETNNARLNITGMLIMLNDRFLQVLEGPAHELNFLYEKIMQDRRHRNPHLLSYTAIHQRHFQAWSMRGVNLARMKPQLAALLVKKYGTMATGLVIPEDPWLAYSLLYDIYCDVRNA